MRPVLPVLLCFLLRALRSRLGAVRSLLGPAAGMRGPGFGLCIMLLRHLSLLLLRELLVVLVLLLQFLQLPLEVVQLLQLLLLQTGRSLLKLALELARELGELQLTLQVPGQLERRCHAGVGHVVVMRLSLIHI